MRTAPRYDRLVRCGAAVVLLPVAACGASSTVEDGPTCGGIDPVQLLGPSPLIPTPSEVDATIAGDHVVASVYGRDATNEPIEQVFAVDLCGAQAVELVAADTTPSVLFGVAGPWVVAVEEGTRRVRWVDPNEGAPSHVVFESKDGCAFLVAGGLAMGDSAGTIWFHPDPKQTRVAGPT